MNTEQTTWARRFKWISLLEGISFLLLLGIAMPLKYVFDLPLAVKYTGWAHGILFIVYVYMVFPTASKLNWNFSRTFFALIASVLPFGPFIFHRYLKRDQQVHL